MDDTVEARYGWLRAEAVDLESRARVLDRLAQEREDGAPLRWGIGSRYYLDSLSTAEQYREQARQLRVEHQQFVELGRNLRRLHPELNALITRNNNHH